MITYLLGAGSPTHPLSPNSWFAWELTRTDYRGYRCQASSSPLFFHQYSHASFDFRNMPEHRPPFVDYFQNSVKATRAHQKFFVGELSKEFPKYSPTMWGMSASDSQKGYFAWGAPPRHDRTDPLVVPYAVADSSMFTPDIALPTLNEIKEKYGKTVYGRYGIADAFNPHNGWVATDVLGIDVGISLIGAENLKSGKVWYWFMQNEEPRVALSKVGIK